MLDSKETISNLIVVATVEEYARRHNLTTENTIKLFNKHHIFPAIREQYEVLHMLDLDEGASLAEDLLNKVSS